MKKENPIIFEIDGVPYTLRKRYFVESGKIALFLYAHDQTPIFIMNHSVSYLPDNEIIIDTSSKNQEHFDTLLEEKGIIKKTNKIDPNFQCPIHELLI